MSDLLVDRRDGVVTLTLNRPDTMNAITGEMWGGLEDVFAEVARNFDDRVLVVTGAGRAFCAGADLIEQGMPRTSGRRLEHMRGVGRSAAALRGIGKPTVAKVNGVAAGAGLSLALGCDLVIASDAARFSAIFVQRGLSIDYGGSWLLPRLVGIHKAKELALLADMIGRMGFRTRSRGHNTSLMRATAARACIASTPSDWPSYRFWREDSSTATKKNRGK